MSIPLLVCNMREDTTNLVATIPATCHSCGNRGADETARNSRQEAACVQCGKVLMID